MAKNSTDEKHPLIKHCSVSQAIAHGTVLFLALVSMNGCGVRADGDFAESMSQIAENPPDTVQSASDNPESPASIRDNLLQPLLPDRSGQQKMADEAIHILGGNLNVISQWAGDIRFALIGAVSQSTRQHALQVFDEISVLTERASIGVTHEIDSAARYLNSLGNSKVPGIYNCTLVDDSQCANFVIVFSSVEMMRSIAIAIPLRDVYLNALDREEDVVCFFSPVLGRGRMITGGFVFIRQGLSDAMIRTCLFEEIYQSFGVFNDYTNSDYFSFNNRIEPKNITFYDRALLRALYDPEFTSGTPAFRVLNRFKKSLGFTSLRK